MEIEEAAALVRKSVAPILESEPCALESAFGRVLAKDVFAPIDLPPYAKSAMDGYAVRAADTEGASAEKPVRLKVLGELFAGDWKEIPFRENSAVRVMTGSPVPKGYDAVVMQEDTDCGQEEVLICKNVRPLQNYCAQGEDAKKGERLLPAGTRLGRAEIAVLASLGLARVQAKRPARVSILCVGSELADPCLESEAGPKLAPGKIYSSLGSALSCSVKDAGFVVAALKILADDESLIASEIKNAARGSDIVITTGGVSVGKKDFLPKVLKTINAKPLFCGVNVQPGTPTRASLLDGKLILSLSGNPFAALANFDLYFYEAAARLMECDSFLPRRTEAVLQDDYKKASPRRRLLRARLDGGKVFLPAQNHASSVIVNLIGCNCYVDVPAGKTLLAGDKVFVWNMGGTL